MVLRAHQDKTYPGAMVASLSVPWGNTPRTSAAATTWCGRAILSKAPARCSALGAIDEARNMLRYLIATQVTDGHWNQNQWLGGTPYWQGVQLDETALPVLLAAALAERDALAGIAGARHGAPRASASSSAHGPATDQDRWEEDAGLNTFTLAVCIAALVAGAALPARPRARDWRWRLPTTGTRSIEEWTAVSGHRARARLRRARLLRAAAPRGLTRRDRAAIGRRAPASRTGNRRRRLPPTSRSAPISCSWCASACAAPTIR